MYSHNPSALSLHQPDFSIHETDSVSQPTSPLPIRTAKHTTFSAGPLYADDDDDNLADRTFVDRRDTLLFPKHTFFDDQDDERPYHQTSGDHLWTEKDLNALQEGDRLGIGLQHEGFLVVDALEQSPESNYGTPDDGILFEIVRQL